MNLTWLDRQLRQRHLSSARDVFLAVCDKNRKLVIFEYAKMSGTESGT